MQTLNEWAHRIALGGSVVAVTCSLIWWLWDLLEGYVPLIPIGLEG